MTNTEITPKDIARISLEEVNRIAKKHNLSKKDTVDLGMYFMIAYEHEHREIPPSRGMPKRQTKIDADSQIPPRLVHEIRVDKEEVVVFLESGKIKYYTFSSEVKA